MAVYDVFIELLANTELFCLFIDFFAYFCLLFISAF